MKQTLLRRLALAATLSGAMLGAAHAAQYTALDSEASSLKFGYSQMNVNMNGGFGSLKAPELRFDPADPAAAKVVLEVALGSVDAGYDQANAELQKDEWLALAKHPVATFQSTQVEPLGENRFQVTGDLSIKGVTREVTAPFSFKEDGDVGVFEGTFTIQRGDYGIGDGPWKDFSIVANDIPINFRLVATQ